MLYSLSNSFFQVFWPLDSSGVPGVSEKVTDPSEELEPQIWFFPHIPTKILHSINTKHNLLVLSCPQILFYDPLWFGVTFPFLIWVELG